MSDSTAKAYGGLISAALDAHRVLSTAMAVGLGGSVTIPFARARQVIGGLYDAIDAVTRAVSDQAAPIAADALTAEVAEALGWNEADGVVEAVVEAILERYVVTRFDRPADEPVVAAGGDGVRDPNEQGNEEIRQCPS